MKRFVQVAALAATTALVAAACSSGPSSQATGTAPKILTGGTFRLGTTSGIDSLNPFVGFQADAYLAFEYMYPYLVQFGTVPNFAGDFATRWTTTPDGRTWTFFLHPNAKWSDGQPLTSDDVAWTLNTMFKFRNGPTSYWAGTLAHFVRATTPSPTEVVLTYNKPVANVLSQLQQIPILPKHVWARYATGNGKALKTFQNPAPIVSGGPFILQRYVQKQVALFVRNPSFYGPKPFIQAWGLEYFSNPDAEITALQSHQLDAVESVPPTDVAAVRRAGFKVNAGPGLEFHDFIINSDQHQLASHRELLNPLLREAFEYAIDRRQIVKTSYLGYATPGSTIIPPSTGIWHDSAITPLPFDLAKANQLLDQAGYKMGPNGVRIADGHPMQYTVIFPSDESGAGDRTFQIIQGDFAKIGVKLVQQNLDNSAAFNAILKGNYADFELAMWDWVPYYDPDFQLSVLTCNQRGGWSDTGYCNPAYDTLYQQQGVTLDQAKRVQIVHQMQQIVYNARPYIVLDYPDIVEAVNAKAWAGWRFDPGAGSFSSNAKYTFEHIHRIS